MREPGRARRRHGRPRARTSRPPCCRHPASPSTTHWVTYPGLYTATCKSVGGDTWLQVNDVGSAADKRPRVTEQDGASWGFHVADVNLALGNLVEDVQRQETAFRAGQK